MNFYRTSWIAVSLAALTQLGLSACGASDNGVGAEQSAGSAGAGGSRSDGGGLGGGTDRPGSGGGAGAGGTSAGGASGGGQGGSGLAGNAPSGAGGASGGSTPPDAGGTGMDGGRDAGGRSDGAAEGGKAEAATPLPRDGGSSGSTSDAPTTGTPDPNNGASGGSKPSGFAGTAGLGLTTTTGGAGGMRVTATTFEELAGYLDTEVPMIIVVQGTIDLGGMVPIRSNKTLVGLPGAKLVNGGLEMNKRQNIIVRNIAFADASDDTFKINQNTHHVWVDHCDFTNALDGLFDITRQSSFITVSWNKFYKHSKTMLIGHSDAETGDIGFLKTTIHHNWFDGTEQRHPRVRFGEVHVFNNLFVSNRLYGVASTMEAKVVVEGNYFDGVPFPTYSGYDESAPGDLVERNNAFVNSGVPQTRGTAFDPAAAYAYVMEDPKTLPAIIRSKAGVGVIDPMEAAR